MNSDVTNGSVEDPSILEYVDYRQYLRDKLKTLQAKNPKYSQRWVAKRAGFQSPHLLSMIVAGKRTLTAKNAGLIADSLKLEAKEKEYFLTIVNLAQASSEEERKEVLKEIEICFKNGLFSDIPVSGLDLFLHWYYVAMSQVVILKDFKNDPAWIAEKLGITKAQAEDGMAFLLRAGFVVEEDGKFVRANPSIRNKYKTYPLQLTKFKLQMIEHAFRAHGYEREKRYFEGLTFAMPLKLMPEIIHRTQKFFKELDDFIESNSEPKDEIFHVSLQMFPLSKY